MAHPISTVRLCLPLIERHKLLHAEVERYNPYTQRSADLFGFGDLLLLDPHRRFEKVLCVQTFSKGSFQVHARKLRGKTKQALEAWLRHNHFEFWEWGKWNKESRKTCRYTTWFLNDRGKLQHRTGGLLSILPGV